MAKKSLVIRRKGKKDTDGDNIPQAEGPQSGVGDDASREEDTPGKL